MSFPKPELMESFPRPPEIGEGSFSPAKKGVASAV
jgi:hypothetical protein